MASKKFLWKIGNTLGVDASGIQVYEERTYDRVLRDRNLGLGETYMLGWWDCDRLDEFIFQLQRKRAFAHVRWSLWFFLRYLGLSLWSGVRNFQSKEKSLQVGVRHYDLEEELYARMLDSRRIYSCGYWKEASTLEKAQEDKLDLICRKLHLREGMKVLDIGCGWGGFALYASEKYGVQVVGITISKKQWNYAQNHAKTEKTEFKFLDYRDLRDPSGPYHQAFDAVVSIGMIEHVGVRNYASLMKIVSYVLKEEGLFLLHTIVGSEGQRFGDPWFEKYIFPHSMLPSLCQLTQSWEKIFVLEDAHNFGADYDKTLRCWYDQWSTSWSEFQEFRIRSQKPPFSDTFRRMWTYYLLCSAGCFRARNLQLFQFVLSKHGVLGGYDSVR